MYGVQVDFSKDEHSRKFQPDFHEWEVQSSKIRDQYDIPRSATPWTSSGAKMHGVPQSARILDVLDCAWAIHRKHCPPEATTAEIANTLWVDLATAVGRKPWSEGYPGVFRQNSMVYSFHADAVLSGAARMQLMGWPASSFPRRIEDSLLRQMCGECFSLPLCAFLHLCLYCNPYGEWWG